MTTIIKTPYESIEVALMKTSLAITTLRFKDINTNEEFTITYSSSFPNRPANELYEWAKRKKYLFPNVAQIRLINRVCRCGLNEWIIENNIRFSFNHTYITDEVLSATIDNPYGEDLIVKKYVAYSVYNNEVKILNEEEYTRYVLINYKE